MAKPNRRRKRANRRATRARANKSIISLLAIGEGAEKGRVYERARRLAERGNDARIVIVDLKRPEYEPPRTLNFVSRDAMQYLEGLSPCSVKRVEENYAFSPTTFGRHWKTTAGKKRVLNALKAVSLARKFEGIAVDRKAVPNIKRNVSKYFKLIKRALVPGGRFVSMTGSNTISLHLKGLRNAGFRVTSRALTREEILKSGSGQAKYELEEKGIMAHRITAVKPKRS